MELALRRFTTSSTDSNIQITRNGSNLGAEAPGQVQDELARVCVPLREELKRLRDSLFAIQDTEYSTLREYRDTEIELQRLLNNRKSAGDGRISQTDFNELISTTSSNRELREKIVDTDHKVFFKISEAQKKASDARFKFDSDRLLGKDIQEELERLRQKTAQLEMLLEAIRAEYIGLTISEKSVVDEQKRLQQKLDEQQQEFDEMTEPYVKLKAQYEHLLNERNKREKALLRRLDAVIEKRDKRKEAVSAIRKEQDEYRTKIAELEDVVADLTYKRDMVNSEVEHVISVANRRKEQCEIFTQMINE